MGVHVSFPAVLEGFGKIVDALKTKAAEETGLSEEKEKLDKAIEDLEKDLDEAYKELDKYIMGTLSLGECD